MITTQPEWTTYGLDGQVAVVTGGGRGLGRAFALALASVGVKVAVTARTETELNETVRLIETSGGTAIAFTADVTDRAAMQRVFAEVEQRLGPVDILVNNAAVVTPYGYDWDVDPDEWWRTMEINVRGPFECVHMLLPSLMARRRGRIVNITSGAAYDGHPYNTAYCASKAALNHWTTLVAEAAKDYGLTLFALGPSGPTAMVEIGANAEVVPADVRASYRQYLEEASADLQISSAMLMFLVSGQADHLTGRYIHFAEAIDDLRHAT